VSAAGGGAPPVTSKASTTTNVPLEDTFEVPVTSITSVWLAAINPPALNITWEAAGRFGVNVSLVATTTPSRWTRAIPHISHGKPIQLTPVPVNVNVAVAPAAAAAIPRSWLSATWTSALVITDHAPAGVAVVSSNRVSDCAEASSGDIQTWASVKKIAAA
jgi:hypothetical protein